MIGAVWHYLLDNPALFISIGLLALAGFTSLAEKYLDRHDRKWQRSIEAGGEDEARFDSVEEFIADLDEPEGRRVPDRRGRRAA